MNNDRKWPMILILLLLASGISLAEKPVIATVDMQKLLKEHHLTLAAQKRFSADYARIQKSIDEKSDEVKKMRAKLQSIAAEIKKEKISEKTKLAKQQEGKFIAQEIKMTLRLIDDLTRIERAKVAQKKNISKQAIMAEIKETVVSLAEKKGYDYVFDQSGLNTNQVSFFLYLKDTPDITTSMLKELNKPALGVFEADAE